MSLTFQLARGGLAIAMFSALALTALLAPSAAGPTRVILIDQAGTVVTVCPVPPPVLRLAQSPADLPASHRAHGSCRA
jgi:hypothetical protein